MVQFGVGSWVAGTGAIKEIYLAPPLITPKIVIFVETKTRISIFTVRMPLFTPNLH